MNRYLFSPSSPPPYAGRSPNHQVRDGKNAFHGTDKKRSFSTASPSLSLKQFTSVGHRGRTGLSFLALSRCSLCRLLACGKFTPPRRYTSGRRPPTTACLAMASCHSHRVPLAFGDRGFDASPPAAPAPWPETRFPEAGARFPASTDPRDLPIARPYQLESWPMVGLRPCPLR